MDERVRGVADAFFDQAAQRGGRGVPIRFVAPTVGGEGLVVVDHPRDDAGPPPTSTGRSACGCGSEERRDAVCGLRSPIQAATDRCTLRHGHRRRAGVGRRLRLTHPVDRPR